MKSVNLCLAISLGLLAGCQPADSDDGNNTTANLVTQSAAKMAQRTIENQPVTDLNYWFVSGQEKVQQLQQLTPMTEKPRNVILFIGDGMSPTTVTAARILAGQLRGQTGEEHQLSFDDFPYTAMIKTYNTDSQVPDSAGTMSAMTTGVKTRAGVISVADPVERGDCAAYQDHRLMTNLMLAAEAGIATGVVTNTRLTHATPAATYAWSPDRNFESDADISAEGKEAGCVDIAAQLLDFAYGRGVDVAFGGGRQQFTPQATMDPYFKGVMGKRADGRDLTQEWQQRHNHAHYVSTAEQLNSLPVQAETQVLGLFAPSHNDYRVERLADQHSTQPSLKEMTVKAMEILQAKGDEGYLLVVESGRIDHGHHEGNAYRALHEVIELDEAVAAAWALAGEETLIMVTSDHSHTLSMGGYPQRGNDILGLVGRHDHQGEFQPDLDQNKQPYTTLSYANGPGARYAMKPLSQAEVTHQDYQQRAITPLYSETHGGEDVVLFATGPGAQLARGTLEQHVIFHLIDTALNLTERAASGK